MLTVTTPATTPTSPLATTATAPTSPLATAAAPPRETIVRMTAAARERLLALRDAEPEGDRLGLRLEVISGPGEEFRYDLVFEEVTKAAFTDEVRTIDGLKVIVPSKDLDLLHGSELDHTDEKGLIIRNPNRPKAPAVEGLTRDDETSAAVETIVASEVNPMLAAHGGFVTYAGHDGEGTAYFTMGGGCHGCSMSRQTMLEGVQTMVSERVPAITRVRDLTDHTTGENPYYR